MLTKKKWTKGFLLAALVLGLVIQSVYAAGSGLVVQGTATTVNEDNTDFSKVIAKGGGISLYTGNPVNYNGETAKFIGSGTGSTVNQPPVSSPYNTGDPVTSGNYVVYYAGEGKRIAGFEANSFVNQGRVEPVSGNTDKNLAFLVSEDGVNYTLLTTAAGMLTSEFISTGGESIRYYKNYPVPGASLPEGTRYLKVVWPRYTDNVSSSTGLVVNVGYGRYAALGDVTLTLVPEKVGWDNVKIGPGGFTTGLVIHPTEPGVMYTRTDVGGAYRWDPSNKRWIPLLDATTREEYNLYGIDGIALAATNPDVVYVAAGMYADETPGDVLKSSDRGETWVRTNLNKSFAGNSSNSEGAQRLDGECIAVDPKTSAVVYSGTRLEGLWVSTNYGGNWSQVMAVPAGTDPGGIRTVVFDPNSGTTGGKTKVLYVGVNGIGIYKTSDGGVTWSLMTGSPKNPKRMEVASNGTLYVTSGVADAVIDSTGVFKYSGAVWTNITPRSGYPYGALAVDPNNPNIVMCVEQLWASKQPIYRSTDGGATWTNTVVTGKYATSYPDMPWRSGYFANIVADIDINPFNSKEVWFTDGQGVWSTPDITASVIQWSTTVKGIEELCVVSLSSPPSGAPLLSGVLDNSGFRHTDIKQSPTARFLGSWDSYASVTTSIDYCESDPNYVVRLANLKPGGADARFVRSTDNGATWTAGTWDVSYGSVGKIAVSSTKQANGTPMLVALPVGKPPMYSTDFGTTWTVSNGPSSVITTWWQYKRVCLAADKVDGNKFYIYDYSRGDFYTSTDGGKNFVKGASLPLQNTNNQLNTVKAKPGVNGEVWVSLYEKGLYKSTNSGTSFTPVANVQEAMSFSFGKNAPGRTNPTIFVYGIVNNTSGIFRSDDDGITWVRINDSMHPVGDQPRNIEGDRQVYGRVYIPTGGRGIMVAELLGSTPATLFTVSPAEAVTTAISAVKLNFSTPVDMNTLTAQNVAISPGITISTAISGTRLSDNQSAVLLLDGNLARGTSYTVTFGAGVKDVYGRSIPDSQRVITFQTAP